MSGKEQYELEHLNRINQLSSQAAREQSRPNLLVRREMQRSAQSGNPFIQPGRPFISMGHDGFSNEWFPTGSFETTDEVFDHIEAKRREETQIYSRYAEEDGSFEIATTFHAFTLDGIELRNRPGE